MSPLKPMTAGSRCGPCVVPVVRNTRPADTDADAFSAWLDAQQHDAPRDRTQAADGPALRGDGGVPTPLSPSDTLSLRLANGPLAGLTLHARTESGRLVVRLETTDAALRSQALRARERLTAELTARFERPITLEWPDATGAR